ncbi:hypothetical protein BH18ACI5_BH18ACI5_29870 [soil metagenome]
MVAFTCALVPTTSARQGPVPAVTPEERQLTDGALRTFKIDKPATPTVPASRRLTHPTSFRVPAAHDALRATVGIGYVQGADWGTEIMSGGNVAGRQVQLNALVTKGREGVILDQGAISVFDPEARWRVEAGDVFSHLRGASRGVRLSLPTSSADRRPAFAVYGPRRGSHDRSTIVSYRDQLRIGEQTVLDAEVASDRSFVLRNHFVTRRASVEAFYRSMPRPLTTRDASLSGGVTLWRGIGLNAGIFGELSSPQRNQWRTVAVRLPLARYFDLTLERTHAVAGDSSQTTSAAMGGLTAGRLRLFHRQQLGEYDFIQNGFTGTIERQQSQSVMAYTAGSRLNVTLQLATQRLDTGQIQHWEEMQTSIRLTSTTTLRAVTAVPNVRDAKRWRAYFRQELPGRFSVQADYGRLSAFQSVPSELDRSRFKLMLFRTWDVATPARGGVVTGRVTDDSGRGVAGAGVKLGPYTTETDASGGYTFKHVPAGQYALGLDRYVLPADVAWDGREERLTITSRSHLQTSLRVAPLNAIHGRIYCDRNDNGRFDRGEGVSGVMLHLHDKVTLTDKVTATAEDGSYTFANLWPATYAVRLDTQKFRADFTPDAITELSVTLGDDGPVTGADFRVLEKIKPVIWSRPLK